MSEGTLPITGLGRCKKAEREGWDQAGKFTARFPSREQVVWEIRGDDRRQPRLVRATYHPRCDHWRASTTRGEWDANQSELARGTFEEVVDAAMSFMDPDEETLADTTEVEH